MPGHPQPRAPSTRPHLLYPLTRASPGDRPDTLNSANNLAIDLRALAETETS
jgi:hypothetical protein